MPNFNLDEYELVEDRIRAFYNDYPDGRIVSYDLTSEADRAKGYFVVRAQLFLDHGDQEDNCPKATGLAFEIEGGAGANRTAALENAETSAIGRALANADYAKGKRPSRQEMEKAQRGPAKKDAKIAPESAVTAILEAPTVELLEAEWNKAVEGGYSASVSDIVKKRKQGLANGHV
jgi:hypothetical protein